MGLDRPYDLFEFQAKPSILDTFWFKFDVLGQTVTLVSGDLGLAGACLILDTSSEAALDVRIRDQTQN